MNGMPGLYSFAHNAADEGYLMGEVIRVLHVDDEPGFSEMVVEYLERVGEDLLVESETTAREGLDALAEHEIDCIVSDFNMPGMTGIEFLEAVRESHPKLPFILFTGKGSEEVASDAIGAGATDYFQKKADPGQYELLANRIQSSVKQRRQERDLARYERIVQAAGDGLYTLDEDGHFTTVNDHVLGQAGYTREELLGSHVSLLLDEEDVDAGAAAIQELLETETKESVTLDMDVHPKAGGPFPFELTIALLPRDGGEFRGSVGIARDRTARRKRDRRLKTYERLRQD